MMDKVRVHEIAKELGINSKEVVDKAAAMGLVIKTASSSVSMEEAEKNHEVHHEWSCSRDNYTKAFC